MTSQPEIPPAASWYASGLIALPLHNGGHKEHPWEGDDVVIRMSEYSPLPEGESPSQSVNLDTLHPLISEAFQLMCAGDQWRVWIASASGSDQYQVYDLELISFKHTGRERIIPPDLRSPTAPD